MLEAHWRYVRQMHDEGKLLVAGPSWVGDDPFGIGVVDLRERAEVEAMLAEDPAITSGAMQAEIRPMRIVTRQARPLGRVGAPLHGKSRGSAGAWRTPQRFSHVSRFLG
jgi:uncharacterized protein YciI